MKRMQDAYGAQWIIHYRDWSRRRVTILPQSKIAEVVSTDKFRASKVCNTYHEELSSYRIKGGRLFHSRPHCSSLRCTSNTHRQKKFVDRDQNAAANILKVGLGLYIWEPFLILPSVVAIAIGSWHSVETKKKKPTHLKVVDASIHCSASAPIMSASTMCGLKQSGKCRTQFVTHASHS